LTRWSRGNASYWGARGPGLESRLCRGFLFLILCFVVVVIFLFVKTHYLSTKFGIPFAMVIYLIYLTYCKLCVRLQGYKDTDLAYLIKLDKVNSIIGIADNIYWWEATCICRSKKCIKIDISLLKTKRKYKEIYISPEQLKMNNTQRPIDIDILASVVFTSITVRVSLTS